MLEESVHVEPVVVMEQTQQQAARSEDVAEAMRGAMEAQRDAQRVREDVRRIRDEVREQVRSQIHGELGGQGRGGPQTQVITVPPPPMPWETNTIPPEIVDVVTMVLIALVVIIVGLPIARAIGRWIDRRGAPPVAIGGDVSAQMSRIEHAVEAMAIEVERISEAQRFQAKLLSDREKVRV
jgi:hypothetical protein